MATENSPQGSHRFSRLPIQNNEGTTNDWGGYIDVRLTGDDKLLFAAWFEANANEFWQWTWDMLPTNHKFGLSWDGANNCFVANFTGLGVRGDSKRYSLTARSGKLDEAVALLCYKHYIMLEGDWGNYRPKTQYKQDWG